MTVEDEIFVGIDPGDSGGIAVIEMGLVRRVALSKLPTERDVWLWLRMTLADDGTERMPNVYVVMERVGGFMGVGAGERKQFNRASGHTMFTFGESSGMLKGMLAALGFEEGRNLFMVLPKVWQKNYGMVRNKGEARTGFKNRLRKRAEEVFPSERFGLSTADAALMAGFCRRLRERMR